MKLLHLDFVLLRSSFARSSYLTIKKMASTTDHLTRTAANIREKILASAKVRQIEDMSSTVKRMHLYIEDQNFTFKAGQWVDMFIPGVETVGGFSMCSAPDLLTKTRILQLAIKFSQHPPAHWVHTQCQVGDFVQLRIGGDFYYDPQLKTESSDLLFLAGGVGINPLYSMLQHFLFLHSNSMRSSGDNGLLHNERASMLYSAQNPEELIFKDELIQAAQCSDKLTLKMFCTQKAVSKFDYVTEGRIQLVDIKQALAPLDKNKTSVYICGPPPFIDAMKSFCLDSGVKDERIFIEKWW